MQYVIVKFEDGVEAYRECDALGNIYRYTDVNGVAITRSDTPTEVVDGSPPFPAWGLPDPPVTVSPPAKSTVMTRIEFLARFTLAEQVAIYTLAKTNVQLEVWMDHLRMAGEVDVSYPDTIIGVQTLEAAGLLAAGRAAEILNG